MFYLAILETALSALFGKQTYALATNSTCIVELTSFVSRGRKLVMAIELQYMWS